VAGGEWHGVNPLALPSVSSLLGEGFLTPPSDRPTAGLHVGRHRLAVRHQLYWPPFSLPASRSAGRGIGFVFSVWVAPWFVISQYARGLTLRRPRKNIDPEQVRQLAGWGLTQNEKARFVGWNPQPSAVGPAIHQPGFLIDFAP